MRIGIAGATGLTGRELSRLARQHPKVKKLHLFSTKNQGTPYKNIVSYWQGSEILENWDPQNLPALDVLFLALPHNTCHAYMSELINQQCKIIDLSADFRLPEGVYNKTYGTQHACASLITQFVPGIPELYRDQIKKAQFVANPGCYANSIILGLAPFNEIANSKSIIVDAKSGVSGVGLRPSPDNHYCQVNEQITAYQTFKHRHALEIQNILNKKILMNAQVLPMNRGILSCIYMDNEYQKSYEQILNQVETFYKDMPFVRVLKAEKPSTQSVRGTNFCDLSIVVNDEVILIFSAIDNLLKGASGLAVQNMNLMMNFPETDGLNQFPPHP